MSKTEAEELHKLSISRLKKLGFICSYKSGQISWSYDGEITSSMGIEASIIEPAYIRLTYTKTDFDNNKQTYDYKIALTATRCNYGKERYWFICPLVRNGKACLRRVGVLYKGGQYFGCRHCYNLTYESRNRYCVKQLRAFNAMFDYEDAEEALYAIKRPIYAGKLTKRASKYVAKMERYQPVNTTFIDPKNEL